MKGMGQNSVSCEGGLEALKSDADLRLPQPGGQQMMRAQRDDFGLIQSKIVKVIVSKILELDAAEVAFPRPALDRLSIDRLVQSTRNRDRQKIS
jgi:hypothetical protein